MSSGGCLCGQIRYAFEATPDFVGHCYCRDCQLATGSAFTTVIGIPQDTLTLEGKPQSFTVDAASGRKVTRQFCGQCGTPLFTHAEMNPETVFIKSSTLDQPNTYTPTMSCWTDSAPSWAPAADVAVSFPANPE